jgi:hypothetical protein
MFTPERACFAGGHAKDGWMNKSLDDALRTAIGAHASWKIKLKATVASGISTVTSEDAKCDTCCSFGKWMHAPEQAHLHTDAQFSEINRLHRAFHQTAGEVIGAIEQHNETLAVQLLEADFMPQSEHLITELKNWLREVKAQQAA